MVLHSPEIAVVYWIHLPEHTDYYTEGYIGVTNNPSRRWQDHKTTAASGRHPNNLLTNIINKYGDTLVYDVIFGGTRDQCFSYEKELRPSASIGWNLMSGGIFGDITEDGLTRLRASHVKRSEKAKMKREKQQAQKQLHKQVTKAFDIEDTHPSFDDYLAIYQNEIPKKYRNKSLLSVYECIFYTDMKDAAAKLNIPLVEIYEELNSNSDRFDLFNTL